MELTISFTVDLAESDNEGLMLLNTMLNGGKPPKTRKPRKPMTDEQKAAFRARMVAGQEAKAKERTEELGEELAKGSKTAAAKKPASKKRKKTKK